MADHMRTGIEGGPVSSLLQAALAVPAENPDLPMRLRFEVSSPEIVAGLLSVEDLTAPTAAGRERNIVGQVYDSVIRKLIEHGFPDIHVGRGDPVV